MTDQERKEIIAEVTAIIEEKYKNANVKEDVQSVLLKSRDKWFSKQDNSFTSLSKMGEAFSGCELKTTYGVWENIRKLTCYIFGKRYVRHLSGVKNADEICDRICEFIYNLRMEVKNSDGQVSEHKN